jgi:hypothetical protein
MGTGYFQAFCAKISRFYDDAVAYAFSSANTLPPDVDLAIVSDTESDDEGDFNDSLVVEWY